MKMKFNIKKTIEENTVDGVTNYDAVNEAVQKQTGDIVAKNMPDTDKLKVEARESAIKEFIEGVGIKDVINTDQFIAYAKRLESDEKAQENIRLTNELTDITTKYNTLDKDYQTTSGKLSGFINERTLVNDGANPKDVDYDVFQINKLVSTDKDFTQASEEYRTANPHRFNVTTPEIKTPITTNKPHVVASQGTEVSAVEQILIDKGRLQQT
jgi:hypothetical protein